MREVTIGNQLRWSQLVKHRVEVTIHGKIMVGEIFGKLYKNLKNQCICQIHFRCVCKENCGEWLTIRQSFPLPKFSCVQYKGEQYDNIQRKSVNSTMAHIHIILTEQFQFLLNFKIRFEQQVISISEWQFSFTMNRQPLLILLFAQFLHVQWVITWLSCDHSVPYGGYYGLLIWWIDEISVSCQYLSSSLIIISSIDSR